MNVEIDLEAAVFCAFCTASEHLAVVKRELGDFAQWKGLGLNLGISPSSLEVIEEDYSRASERLHEVLLRWLRRNYNLDKYKPPSWRQLVDAVEPINRALAIAIKERYL